jgi:para-aminobenzoate synthetase component I
MKFNPWINPLDAAEYLTEKYSEICFLFSGSVQEHSGRKSFLAFDLDTELQDLNLIKKHLEARPNEYLFGYFSYETNAPRLQQQTNYINFPYLKFSKYKNLIIFDHQERSISYNCAPEILAEINNHQPKSKNSNYELELYKSNMTDTEYLHNVATIQDDIAAGDYCQANLTRKYWGKYKEKNISHFEIFRNLSNINPAPYSSFIKEGSQSIISSSPERFIAIDEDGKINTRPIKGTNKKTASNEQAKQELYLSIKDRSENLMIVDLMRNDLTKHAKLGSVSVDRLFQIDSHPTLNHMSSSISALKKDGALNIDIITKSMPPGSMTGAPKIKVIERLQQIEKLPRNIYSGTIGYFHGNKSCDFSVVIRTILMTENKFSYQVGGAIIFDSKPELELEETKTKDFAMRKALQII